MTVGTVDDINRNTPAGVHYAFADMTDPAKNIRCGTSYLDIIYNRSGKNQTLALNRFGTGPGYAGTLLLSEACLIATKIKNGQIDPIKAQSYLGRIHK